MRLGWYISVAGHLALILFLLFGGIFSRDHIPEVAATDVSIISEAEFAALTPPGDAPEFQTDAPTPEAPAEDEAPDAPSEDAAPEVTEPEPVEPPDTTEEPTVEQPPVIPDAIVEDEAPVIDTPSTLIDGSSPLAEGTPDPAPRVAPTPQVAPPPEAEVAPDVIPDVAPEPDEAPAEETPPDEAQAAPEEASDRIVTEAEEDPNLAPASALRPRSRPARPVRQAEPTPEPEPEPEPTPSTDDAVREALGAPEPDSGRPGPPLTGGEKDAFRVAVGNCWVVDSGAQSAGITVVVGFSLDPQGRVQGDVRQLSASGGDAAAQRSAFERARRAVLRCQGGGYDLPPDKYETWRDVEITFNPEGMQFR